MDISGFDQNILEFQPVIDFIEPDQEPQEPNPVSEPEQEVQLEEVQAFRKKVTDLAKAVELLAAATQARVDIRAKNLVIKLNSKIDADTIQAMLRAFPGSNPNEITYEQYRKVKERIRNKGISIGQKASISPEEVALAKEQALKNKEASIQNGNNRQDGVKPAGDDQEDGLAKGKSGGGGIGGGNNGAGGNLGGFGTPESGNGGLRPELDERSTIIESVDINDLQIRLICILVNFIWKSFIIAAFKKIKLPFGPSIASILPKRLCDPGIDINIPGLAILGLSEFKLPKAPKTPDPEKLVSNPTTQGTP